MLLQVLNRMLTGHLLAEKGELLLCNSKLIKIEVLLLECIALLNDEDYEKEQQMYKFHKKIEIMQKKIPP